MAERSRMLTLVLMLGLLGSCLVSGTETFETKLLAAMPILETGMTQMIMGMGSDELDLSIGRAVFPRVVVRAEAGSAKPFDLNIRLTVPPQLFAPAFFAVELAPTSVTGLMTLFFGPVAIDLGRTWFEPSRWALAQLIVHPRLTMVVGGIEESEIIVPLVGWRIFPSSSARWEIDMLFTGREIRVSVGGYL